MKTTKVIDIWKCDLVHNDGETCMLEDREQMPNCVVCDSQVCKSHREMVTATVSRPHREPRPDTRESVQLVDRTGFWVCSNCRWPLARALKKYWPGAIKGLLEKCCKGALAEKQGAK